MWRSASLGWPAASHALDVLTQALGQRIGCRGRANAQLVGLSRLVAPREHGGARGVDQSECGSKTLGAAEQVRQRAGWPRCRPQRARRAIVHREPQLEPLADALGSRHDARRRVQRRPDQGCRHGLDVDGWRIVGALCDRERALRVERDLLRLGREQPAQLHEATPAHVGAHQARRCVARRPRCVVDRAVPAATRGGLSRAQAARARRARCRAPRPSA